jgi:hypothetical protein
MKLTTVIPAYKSKYLFELLAGLAQQTEPPDAVIFSDDTQGFAFAQVLYAEPVKSLIAHLNVSVVEGPRKGAHANWAHCMQAWGGRTELVHLLCDDDVIYPTFYEEHRLAHASGYFSATVSKRWFANESGQPLRKSLNVPMQYARNPQKLQTVDARSLFETTVARSANWLGEMSNTVMRRETAELVLQRQYAGIGYAGLEDLGSMVCGAMAAPLCFINEHLGYFRLSAEQNSSNTMGLPMKLAHLAYVALALIGRNCGQLSAEQAHEAVVSVGSSFLWHFRDEEDMREMRQWVAALAAQAPQAEVQFLQGWAQLQRTATF